MFDGVSDEARLQATTEQNPERLPESGNDAIVRLCASVPRCLGASVSSWPSCARVAADRERVVAGIDSAISEAGTAWTDEYRFRKADGSYAVVQHRAHIGHDETGTPTRVISAMSGLSNAHRADRQLQQVLDAVQVGVSVIDKQGRIVVANSSDKELWGAAGGGRAR